MPEGKLSGGHGNAMALVSKAKIYFGLTELIVSTVFRVLSSHFIETLGSLLFPCDVLNSREKLKDMGLRLPVVSGWLMLSPHTVSATRRTQINLWFCF